MKEGEVQELTPQFTPALSASETAPDMTWTSSDPEVVTVAKSGTQAELTAVKAGTAEVTVSIKNAEGTELKSHMQGNGNSIGKQKNKNPDRWKIIR